jgi:hypothetical protein
MEPMAAPRKDPDEVRERAVSLVFEWRRARGRDMGGFNEVGEQLRVHPETLRNSVRQNDIDGGRRAGDRVPRCGVVGRVGVMRDVGRLLFRP